jgi:hypothetical protein
MARTTSRPTFRRPDWVACGACWTVLIVALGLLPTSIFSEPWSKSGGGYICRTILATSALYAIVNGRLPPRPDYRKWIEFAISTWRR